MDKKKREEEMVGFFEIEAEDDDEDSNDDHGHDGDDDLMEYDINDPFINDATPHRERNQGSQSSQGSQASNASSLGEGEEFSAMAFHGRRANDGESGWSGFRAVVVQVVPEKGGVGRHLKKSGILATLMNTLPGPRRKRQGEKNKKTKMNRLPG
jgi:hypothetical protein